MNFHRTRVSKLRMRIETAIIQAKKVSFPADIKKSKGETTWENSMFSVNYAHNLIIHMLKFLFSVSPLLLLVLFGTFIA